MSESTPDEEALLAFATNFEFAKQFVGAQGDLITIEVRRLLSTWLRLQIDGADGYIDSQRQAGQRPTDELRILTRQAVEAHDWLTAFERDA